MSCQLCRKTLRSNEGYKLFAFRYCDRCFEDKIRRETREDFNKSTVVQKYVKARDKIKKK